MSGLEASSWRGFRLVTAVSEGAVARSTWPLPERVGHDDGRGALAQDLSFLAEVYTDLLGCPALGVRLERLDEAMCPRWHRDQTGIRLLCTYRGPGTEWLDQPEPQGLDLGDQAVQSRLASGCAGAFDIVLLKGAAWPGNAARGAIHRSPMPGTSARYLLAMDALWDA